ncbi:Brix-domain-containing protein [Clavulina sp. PMI_390]|nr:Brix-domain-containing protein [Clavulina sp. PMI_390]
MLRTIKPKNARSKRAMEAREPKVVEDAKVAIFVRGTKTGERLNNVMKELMALKRPHAISFSKKNDVRPFEDASSLDFWASKNDASLFLLGQDTKKRPDGLTFVRMFDGRVLDMCEVGVTNFVSMADLKTHKSTPGHRPLMHFASELFDSHPRFVQLKSMLLDFFGGEQSDAIALSGLEHVISVSLGPTPPGLTSTLDLDPSASSDSKETLAALPPIHIRTYTVQLLKSGTKLPKVQLTPMGPHLDLVLRRHTEPDAVLLKAALKRPKLEKSDVEKGLGKKRKNMETDEMGDLRGQIHLGKQDLSGLQVRKMKGLKDGGSGSKRRRKDESMEVDDADGDDE